MPGMVGMGAAVPATGAPTPARGGVGVGVGAGPGVVGSGAGAGVIGGIGALAAVPAAGAAITPGDIGTLPPRPVVPAVAKLGAAEIPAVADGEPAEPRTGTPREAEPGVGVGLVASLHPVDTKTSANPNRALRCMPDLQQSYVRAGTRPAEGAAFRNQLPI